MNADKPLVGMKSPRFYHQFRTCEPYRLPRDLSTAPPDKPRQTASLPLPDSEVLPCFCLTATTTTEKLRIVFSKHGLQGRGGSLRHGMDLLDHAKNVRGHHEQISNSARTRIPIGVWRPSWHEHAGACRDLDLVFANLNAQGALEYVPGLVIVVVEMPWCYETRRSRRATGILPFGNNKSIADRAKNVSRKRRSDYRRAHTQVPS